MKPGPSNAGRVPRIEELPLFFTSGPGRPLDFFRGWRSCRYRRDQLEEDADALLSLLSSARCW